MQTDGQHDWYKWTGAQWICWESEHKGGTQNTDGKTQNTESKSQKPDGKTQNTRILVRCPIFLRLILFMRVRKV